MIPNIIAHRGASALAGEDNTLRAFRLAIEAHADAVETDLRRTADGRIVCFHDPGVGGVPVSELTHDELCGAARCKVPTLEEMLDLCVGRIALDLEFKEGGHEQEALDLVAGARPAFPVACKSFDAEVVRTLVRLAPAFDVGHLVRRVPSDPATADPDAALREARRLGADFIAPHYSWLDTPLPARAQAQDMPVWIWTVDDEPRLLQCLDSGIAAVVTNRPEIARTVYNRATAAPRSGPDRSTPTGA